MGGVAVQAECFYATDDQEAGRLVRRLIEQAGFKPVNAGPLKVARQLEQLGVLLHQIAQHEYHGQADLIRIGLSIVEASPGPIVRERIA